MNTDATDLLSQLRDIRVAPEAPFWPPAPGWWLLAALALVLLFFLMRYLRTALQARARRQRFVSHLDSMTARIDPVEQPQTYLASVNRVLKLVAISAFPSRAASLKGREWVQFLDESLEKGKADALAVLATGPYEPAPEFDADELTRVARQWILQHG